MAKLVTNGSFYVVAAAEKGSRPEMVYWDECPANFQFCSGKDGEEVYHIVYNTRDTTSSKYSKTPYLCVVSHKKNSTYPSDDVKNNGANAKWSAFSNMALIATDIMLARKILAGEIDVESLTVKNVNATSSDGETTVKIDGNTGKLSAKNADVSGVITCTAIKLKMLGESGDVTNGSVYVSAGGEFTLPELDYNTCIQIKLFHVQPTKVYSPIFLRCQNSNVRVMAGNLFGNSVYGTAYFDCDVTLIGYRYPSDNQHSINTFWKIIRMYDNTDGITLVSKE